MIDWDYERSRCGFPTEDRVSELTDVGAGYPDEIGELTHEVGKLNTLATEEWADKINCQQELEKLTADVARLQLERDAALNLLADEQSESATKSWPRVAELSNELETLKAELSRPGAAEMLEANHLVNGDRQSDYGTPRQNYEGIARVWSGILYPILKRDITPGEAALMMVGLKLQRQAMKHKRDNLVDAHGYLLVYQHIEEDGGQL